MAYKAARFTCKARQKHAFLPQFNPTHIMMRAPGNLAFRYTDLYFTTVTVKDWKWLLAPDKYKKIITESLHYLVQDEAVRIYAFVIMPNHFHLVWQLLGEHTLSNIQLRLLKFTAQQIKFDLIQHHPNVLERFKVKRKDRAYQFYKERPLSIPIYTDAVASQKIEYIHRNPIQPKWKLSKEPTEYHWSSAAFYESGGPQWPFLTHFWYGEDPLSEQEL